MNQIYAIDSTRISHREYWWGTKSPLVLIGWITKWLRIRIPGSTDDPNFESTTPWVIDALPAEVLERFGPLAGELAALGFHDVAYHCFRDPGTQTTVYWATFLHESGTHFARIHQRIWGQSQKVSRALFPMLLTEFTDGTFLVSSSGKPDMATPATVPMNRMPGAKTAALWAAHLEKTSAHGVQRMPARVATPEEALAATERHHILLRDFNLARGVFRPRDAAEQAKAEKFATSVAQAQAGGLQHAEVMAELERLQEHKPNWGNAVWILVISAVAFLAAGAAQWDWKFTLWIIPVLLFHETGHWVAMRIFGYRNLRMFFIPFFGAAVSGRHWNIAGWKKVLVSLAGPVPGIMLGAAIGIVALIAKISWLNEAAFMLLLVNGFNLLPVLPLDGGHVLHATLFCRHRWLDLAFRVVAIAAFVLMGMFGLGKFLYYIAVALAIGLPAVFKMSKVVDQMRRTPMPPPLLDQDRIPTDTTQAIISSLKAEYPNGISNKILAQHTLGVLETLNAHPPGVLATLGLLAGHAAAFVAAIVFCALLVVARQTGLGEFVSAAARQPQHEIHCGSAFELWQGRGATNNPDAVRNLLVTTLDRHAEALAEFGRLTNELPATAKLALFGDSLLLSLPAGDNRAREQWFNELSALTTNTYVVLSNRPVTLSLMFLAPGPTVATNLKADLTAFSALPTLQLTPPWSPAARSPAYAKHRETRLAWLRIERTASGVWTNSAAVAVQKRIAAATRRGAMAEADRLTGEREQLMRDLAAEAHEKLRAELADSHAAPLLDLHEQLSGPARTNRADRAALLKQVGAVLGESTSPSDHGSAVSYATQHGLLIEAPWCSFGDPLTSLPQLLDWLCGQQCAKIKYDFQDISYFDSADDLN